VRVIVHISQIDCVSHR